MPNQPYFKHLIQIMNADFSVKLRLPICKIFQLFYSLVYFILPFTDVRSFCSDVHKARQYSFGLLDLIRYSQNPGEDLFKQVVETTP